MSQTRVVSAAASTKAKEKPKAARGASLLTRLREALEDGTLRPGQRLIETELAIAFGVSRPPIREAISVLEAEGLVAHEPRVGRVVASLDYQAVMELYAVRERLEGMAAAMAARNASEGEVEALGDMLDYERTIADDEPKLARHNRRFHEAIVRASRNRFLLRTISQLQAPMLLMGRATRTGEARLGTAWEEHRIIVEAIGHRDEVAAEAAIRAHLRAAQRARVRMMVGEDETTVQ